MDLPSLIEPLTELVTRAGAAILDINRETMTQHRKVDGTVVTQADHAADEIIVEGLMRLAPHIPVVSEERVHLAARPYKDLFFLVDPLDGTREFVSGNGEFTVNIALVKEGKPVLGIIGAPAFGTIWRGIVGVGAERWSQHEGGDAHVEPIRTRQRPVNSPCIVGVSRSHPDPLTEALIARLPHAVRQPMGSALKFCRVAEGHADIYPRLAPTSEWDVAAGHALVTAAGGIVTDGDGGPLCFGMERDDFLVPNFIAWGDPAAAEGSNIQRASR